MPANPSTRTLEIRPILKNSPSGEFFYVKNQPQINFFCVRIYKNKVIYDNKELILDAGNKIKIKNLDTNKYVTDNAPWTLAKEEKMTECGQVLTTVLEIMCVVSSLIYPYCPNIAKSMAEQLSYDLNTKLDDVTCDNIKVGHLIDKEAIKPVFLRMDSELADKGKK